MTRIGQPIIRPNQLLHIEQPQPRDSQPDKPTPNAIHLTPEAMQALVEYLRRLKESSSNYEGYGLPDPDTFSADHKIGEVGVFTDPTMVNMIHSLLGGGMEVPLPGGGSIDVYTGPPRRSAWFENFGNHDYTNNPAEYLDSLIDTAQGLEDFARSPEAVAGEAPFLDRPLAKGLKRIHAIRNASVSSLFDGSRPNLVNPRLRGALQDLARRAEAAGHDVSNMNIGELWAMRGELGGSTPTEGVSVEFPKDQAPFFVSDATTFSLNYSRRA